jgi:hypothetical protein
VSGNNRNILIFRRIIILTFLLIQQFISVAQTLQYEQVLLTLRHKAVGYIYVNSLYDYQNDRAYLPVNELFSLLEIDHHSDVRNFTVSGNFITPDKPYTLNLQTMQVSMGNSSYSLTPEDFVIGEMDYFLSPAAYERIFGLIFIINISHLVLSLETIHTLPVEERKARELARSRAEGVGNLPDDFPLGYDRKRAILGGAMMDYVVNANWAGNSKNLGYTLAGGMEVLGGDLQGILIGNHSDGKNYYTTSGLRWRYAIRNNPYISTIMAGQQSTFGLQPITFRGISVTNNPIEPRRMYETYVIDGNTAPESEVEIYVNDRLLDYKRADELGYYRFDVPVTYGTTRIGLRTHTPSGEYIVSDKQMQVPFNFLPRGVVTYNLQAGKTDQAWADTLKDQYITHGDVAVGVNRWLTASAGAQHLGSEIISDDLFYYGNLSARIAKQYLLSLDVAPDAFYRLGTSVMYASNLSFNFIYTKYDGDGIFNARGAGEDLSGNVYIPFKVWGMSTGIRLGGEHVVFDTIRLTNFHTDLNARLGSVNLRLNYRDNLLSTKTDNYFGTGLLTTSITYTISRSPGIPVYVRGMFVRGQVQYDVRRNQTETAEMQLSRTVLKTGRLNLGFGYNFIRKTTEAQLSLTIDLAKLRSTTTINSNNGNFAARQSFSGSIGVDAPNQHIELSNRQQVGRGSAAIVQFVDVNNSGVYDAGDQLLPYRGVKLDRTATMQIGRDSILRVGQLQSYYLYNLSVNRNAIADPTLVPLKKEFSFVVDPNQYKRIEIPYYRGGIVEGVVMIENNGKHYGQGGLRLLIKSKNSDFEQTIYSFSDGGFYTMDLPPGAYTIGVDNSQLGFMGVKEAKQTDFEIKAMAEGDYLEGLIITLIPVSDGEDNP